MKLVYDSGRARYEYRLPLPEMARILRNQRSHREQAWRRFRKNWPVLWRVEWDSEGGGK